MALPLLLLATALYLLGEAAAFGTRDDPAPDSLQGLIAMLPGRQEVRDALRAASVRFNLDPLYLDAIAWVESRWNQGAVNLTGADGARGGAWGACQLTEATARGVGVGIPMRELVNMLDPYADACAAYLYSGHPTSLSDAAAWWNAGRMTLGELPEGHPTRATYFPRLVAAAEHIRAEGFA